MARIVIHEAQGPSAVKVGETEIWVCRCGLTKNEKGLCDKSHKKTLDEKDDALYEYFDDGEREIIGEKDHHCSGDCGDACQCKK